MISLNILALFEKASIYYYLKMRCSSQEVREDHRRAHHTLMPVVVLPRADVRGRLQHSILSIPVYVSYLFTDLKMPRKICCMTMGRGCRALAITIWAGASNISNTLLLSRRVRLPIEYIFLSCQKDSRRRRLMP